MRIFTKCLLFNSAPKPIYAVHSSTASLWTGPHPTEGVPGRFILLPCFIEIHAFNAYGVDPNLTPRSAASDLGLHC